MCCDSSPQERTDIFLRRRAVTHSSFPATSSSSLPLPLFVPLHLRPPSLESFVCVILLFFATKFSHRGCGDFAPVWREKPASIGQFQPIEPPLSPARPAPGYLPHYQNHAGVMGADIPSEETNFLLFLHSSSSLPRTPSGS